MTDSDLNLSNRKSSSWMKPPNHLPKGRNQLRQEPVVFKEAQAVAAPEKIFRGFTKNFDYIDITKKKKNANTLRFTIN
jgi:hypothetical protein